MSNVFNHNRNVFDFKLNKEEYWDFHLCVDSVATQNNDCLSVFIDINNDRCIWKDEIMSETEIVWQGAVNNGIILSNIGLTGVDNGLISFNRDTITNKEFLNLFINSKLEIKTNDVRLILHKIKGNNDIFSYNNEYAYVDDERVLRLNGGFYQSFFKNGCEYQVLPHIIKVPLNINIKLMKKDFSNEIFTLNDRHPDNKGIFFYIGTRAENKWYKFYDTKFNKFIDTDDYVFNSTIDNVDNRLYFITNEENETYTSDDYLSNNEFTITDNSSCNIYVDEEYIEEDIEIGDETNLKTAEGYLITQPNIFEYKTNNKFITYNHTKEGFTIDDNVEEVVLYDIKAELEENYFTLFNNTKNGQTTETIEPLIKNESMKYDVLADLYNNALAFQIKDDGSIGYKYIVKDCDSIDEYKIESEFSYKDTIKEDQWYDINVKIVPYTKNMRLIFYVNNTIVLVSKELPILNLRELNDLTSKQEGVPFNISIGGGTQGLCDTINLDYKQLPCQVLPLEKEFGGSFIGYIKYIKIFTC